MTDGTNTLAGARDHARSLAGAAGVAGLTVPAASSTDLPSEALGAQVVWAETIEAGGYASRRLPRGAVLRIEDVGGDACVQLLVHNAVQPAERINVADTVKVQWQAYLAEGALVLSDMGRAMMTFVSDTSGRHDCLCGCTNRRTNEARYGDGSISGPYPNGRDLLALGLAKFGLSRRDVAPNINLFKTVLVDDAGAMTLDGEIRPGRHVDLRAEMDVIVTVADTPHPLDDRPDYIASPARLLAWLPAEPPNASFRSATPERLRAFQNTDEYLLGSC